MISINGTPTPKPTPSSIALTSIVDFEAAFAGEVEEEDDDVAVWEAEFGNVTTDWEDDTKALRLASWNGRSNKLPGSTVNDFPDEQHSVTFWP